MQFLNLILFAAGVVISGFCFNFAYRLFTADKIESDKSSARVRSMSDALMGRALVRTDWMPDPRIQHGLVFNKKMNRIEINGRMSRGIFDRVFR